MYRIMQEALQNVSTHARASKAEVALGFSPSSVTLAISDDGQGFDLDAARRNGQGRLGLLGMHERAERLGGWLAIRTATRQGTRVELSVPIS